MEKLRENLGQNESKDYYFLVVNKKDTKDIFVNTLKGLHGLQANGNNLPFQCKWGTNKLYQDRSFSEATEFILSVLGKSIKLRAEIYLQFKNIFPEYV